MRILLIGFSCILALSSAPALADSYQGGQAWGTGTPDGGLLRASMHNNYGTVAARVQTGQDLNITNYSIYSAGVMNNITTNGSGNDVSGSLNGENSGDLSTKGTISSGDGTEVNW